MDLTDVTAVLAARSRSDLASWRPGDDFLAGGSWLFSEPQPGTNRLIDLTTMGWSPLQATSAGLEIAATCTLAELSRAPLPAEWTAAPLLRQCCEALLGSFKVQNVATVGGNLCLALPAGPMISLTSALDAVCTIWSSDGTDRQLRVDDLVVGDGQTTLRAGEVLRSVLVPASALRCRTAFRQFSLNPLGRSAGLVIGRVEADGGAAVFGVTAATVRPLLLRFAAPPSEPDLLGALAASAASYHDDVHGLPQWRADLTRRYLAEVLAELVGS